MALGLTSFATPELAYRAGYPSLAMSSAAGFYLWLVSLFLVFAWAWVAAFLQRKHERQ